MRKTDRDFVRLVTLFAFVEMAVVLGAFLLVGHDGRFELRNRSAEFVMRDAQDSKAVKSEPWVVTCDGSFAEQLARSLASEWQTPAQGMSLWSAAFNESSDLPGDAEVHDTGTDADKAPSARVFRVWAASGLPDDALFTAMLANPTP